MNSKQTLARSGETKRGIVQSEFLNQLIQKESQPMTADRTVEIEKTNKNYDFSISLDINC